ncbi:MAG: hypothetical protein VB021_03495 [Oscillospiraceae bacterium]|nr:hypothetical protein [Oscillospiraceae bacterium]
MKTELSSSGRILCRLFHAFWFLAFFGLFVCTLSFMKNQWLSLAAAVLAFALLLAFVCRFRERLDSLPARTFRWICAAVCLFIAAAMAFTGYRMCTAPFNDAGTVYYSVAEILRDGHISTEIGRYTSCAWWSGLSNNDYFLAYKNNIFLPAYLLPYYRVLTFFGLDMYSFSGYYAGVVLDAVHVAGSVFFGACAAEKAKDKTAAFLFLFLCAAFVPYYVHAYTGYSDTLSLPYVSLSLLLYFTAVQKRAGGNSRGAALYFALTGSALAVGTLLKPNVAILFVAMVICEAVTGPNLRRAAEASACIFLALFLLMGVWRACRLELPWLDADKAQDYALPVLQWVMMASKGDGGFRRQDFEFVMHTPPDQRGRVVLRELGRRIRSYGSAGNYLNFEVHKVAAVLADGKYAQAGHLVNACTSRPTLAKILLPDGEYYGLFYAYVTAFQCFLLLCFLASAGMCIFGKHLAGLPLLNIFIFGTLLFFSFWEFKSRYLLNATSAFLLCAALCVSEGADVWRDSGTARRLAKGRLS